MRPGIVLLAAGGSSRLGSPKALLVHAGKTLLRRAAETAIEAFHGPVLVVVGPDASLMRLELIGLELQVIENARWREGLATSLNAGLNLDWEGAIVMLCDQPFVTAASLRALSETQEQTGLPIAAARYEGIMGAPALFHRDLFPELLALRGDQGARSLIQRHQERVATVDMPEAAIDIDTPEDAARLRP